MLYVDEGQCLRLGWPQDLLVGEDAVGAALAGNRVRSNRPYG